MVDLEQPRTFGDILVVWRGRTDDGAGELAEIDVYDG
jgi:hypothetical protein